MKTSEGVILMTREPQTAQAVSDSIQSRCAFEMKGVCRDLVDLHAELAQGQPAAVVVDLDPEPPRMLDELDRLIHRYPKTKFIVCSNELCNEWLLQAMQAGARHYMVKQAIAIELPGVIERIARIDWNDDSLSSGGIITVLSAGGGCGATTVAVNLANELALSGAQSTLLIDFDCCYGSAATHLGVEGQYGLAEVLVSGRPIDMELIRSTVVSRETAGTRLDMLMNPSTGSPSEPAHLDFSHLERLLRVCRQGYEWIVIDAPRLPLDVTSVLVNASIETLLILQLNVSHLRIAKAMLHGLLQRGVAAESILTVANRVRHRYTLVSTKDARRALHHDRLACLGNDYSNLHAALNYGKTLAEYASRSAVRREIRTLAMDIKCRTSAVMSNGRRH